MSSLIQIRNYISKPAERSARNSGVDLARLRERLDGSGADRSSGAVLKSWPAPRIFGSSSKTSFRNARPTGRTRAKRRTFLKLMGASLALGRGERLHQAASGKDRPVCPPAGGDCSGQAAVLCHRASRCPAGASACWPRVTWAGRQSWKEIRIIRRVWARRDRFTQAAS